MTENKEEKPEPVSQEKPTETIPPTPEEKGGALVQSGGQSITTTKVWKWTKKKRKAIRLVLQGHDNASVAKALGVHRHTVAAWRGRSEFQTELLTQAHDYTNRIRFKRVHETGLITNQLAIQTAKGLKKLAESGMLSQADINQLQLLLREYREFRREERQDFGDDVRRIEGNFMVGTTSPLAAPVSTKGSQSFRSFLADRMGNVPQRILQGTDDPMKALVEVTREVLKTTDILDELNVEDVATAEKESREKDRK